MIQVVVLGATGSIGRQTLEVVRGLALQGLRVQVVGLAARRASDDLADIARAWPDADVVAVDPSTSENGAFVSEFGARYAPGSDAMLDLVRLPNSTVVNGIVGSVGLEASVAALEAGNRLGLANKESLIAGGPLVLDALERHGGTMIPIDSEHSAVFQCLVGEDPDDVDRLILTASGGPFRGRTAAQLGQITPGEALAHPTWSMGPRITVDSATLVNKGLEVIEAHFLFGFDYDQIDVVVHPQSVVHSLIEFQDGSLKAHLGATDMRIPIQYALTYPERAPGLIGQFSLTGQSLEFEAPDRATFPALDLAYAAGRQGGTLPAAFNAADEVAVAAFLDERIGFLDIAALLDAVLEAHERLEVTSLDVVRHADEAARSAAVAWVASR